MGVSSLRRSRTSGGSLWKCFAPAAGQVVARRKGRLASRRQAFLHIRSLIRQLEDLGPLLPEWGFGTVQELVLGLELAVHIAEWQAQMCDVSAFVTWHTTQAINMSAQDSASGWRVWAAEACEGSMQEARMLSRRSTRSMLRCRRLGPGCSSTRSSRGCFCGWTRGVQRRAASEAHVARTRQFSAPTKQELQSSSDVTVSPLGGPLPAQEATGTAMGAAARRGVLPWLPGQGM